MNAPPRVIQVCRSQLTGLVAHVDFVNRHRMSGPDIPLLHRRAMCVGCSARGTEACSGLIRYRRRRHAAQYSYWMWW